MARRGRTAQRKNDDNKPSTGPRSQSRASNNSQHPGENKRSQSASGRSQNSGGKHKPQHNNGPHVQKELTEEQKKHQQFLKDQQLLINEVISSITEKHMVKMLENIHTNGAKDETKSAEALKEYRKLGETIKQEWEDARKTVSYETMTSASKSAYDVQWRTKMSKAMAEFRQKYHLPAASSRKEMESIVRNHMSKIAMMNLLQHRSGSGEDKDQQDDLFEQELQQHMKQMKQTKTAYKPESSQNSSANSTAGGQEPESSDGLGGMQQQMEEDDPSGEATSFRPNATLWPTEAYTRGDYTRGDSLRYL